MGTKSFTCKGIAPALLETLMTSHAQEEDKQAKKAPAWLGSMFLEPSRSSIPNIWDLGPVSFCCLLYKDPEPIEWLASTLLSSDTSF